MCHKCHKYFVVEMEVGISKKNNCLVFAESTNIGKKKNSLVFFLPTS